VFKATIAIKTLVKYDHQQASKQSTADENFSVSIMSMIANLMSPLLSSVANCNPIVICN
jgi:hypothetical protein